MPQRRPNNNPAVGAFLPPEPEPQDDSKAQTHISTNTQMRTGANAQMNKTLVIPAHPGAGTAQGKNLESSISPATERGQRVQAQLPSETYEQVTLETARRRLHARDIIIEAAVQYFMSNEVDDQTRTIWINEVHKRRPKRGAINR